MKLVGHWAGILMCFPHRHTNKPLHGGVLLEWVEEGEAIDCFYSSLRQINERAYLVLGDCTPRSSEVIRGCV